MQEKHLFEYAVIRVMPRVEREEFLNAGVILYCKQQRFLQTAITLNEDRLRAFSQEIDINEIQAYLHAFECICKGGKQAGPIGQLEPASRFRWLTATRSTVVQAGKVHPGFCDDPLKALTRLHEQLVL
jgi:hypothetical protein